MRSTLSSISINKPAGNPALFHSYMCSPFRYSLLQLKTDWSHLPAASAQQQALDTVLVGLFRISRFLGVFMPCISAGNWRRVELWEPRDRFTVINGRPLSIPTYVAFRWLSGRGKNSSESSICRWCCWPFSAVFGCGGSYLFMFLEFFVPVLEMHGANTIPAEAGCSLRWMERFMVDTAQSPFAACPLSYRCMCTGC